jgi:CheY-like chemotaxis protein
VWKVTTEAPRAAAQADLEQQIRQGQRLEAVGQLAGGVAHDFNNLLTVIGGNIELALAEVDDPVVKGDLQEVLRSAERATELVRQLLEFSRVDSVEARVVGLNEAVARVRRLLARLLPENIEIRTELAEEQPSILADPGQLEQVLLNLVVNARDAMPAGGVVSICTHADAEIVTLEVSDTGAGMDDFTRERIFNPFFTTKAPGEGTGLGLSTVHGIVNSAGGEIGVESKLGAGTIFTVTFPRISDTTAECAPAPRGFVHGAGQRILLVEDEEMVRAVTAEMLSRAGYTVVTATDGEDALRVVEEEEQPFDLLFTDLMMPRMTGTELAAQLRARGQDLPVVYSSGYTKNMLVDGEPDDRTVVLSKPFSSEALSSAVHELLSGAVGTSAES